jgi:DNA anti-recombination protein RmuC
MFLREGFFVIMAFAFLASCGTNSDSDTWNDTMNSESVDSATSRLYDSLQTMKPFAKSMTDDAIEAQINSLLEQSRSTLDSIDNAYKYIRVTSKVQNLTIEEREQVNEALLQLNNTKELIILEIQQSVISQLKEKTASLHTVIDNLNVKSKRLENIISTLSRVSGIIEKTTNALASALSSGIIRPKISEAAN